MSYLQFIADQDLERHVAHVIDIALGAQTKAADTFHKNVIDPFSAMFEMGGFHRRHTEWKNSELDRKAQKTLQNHVGDFHQKILGSVNGWDDMGVGENIDLMCPSKNIIAEVKNKYNTVSGGKLVDVYDDLEKLITPKASKYFNNTAYFVNIIPRKKKIGQDEPFTPPDRATGQRRPVNQNIRIIDGTAFYALVTGRNGALEELYRVLPDVIEKTLDENSKGFIYSLADRKTLKQYFSSAFK